MPDGKTHAWWTIKRDMARTVTYYLLNVHMLGHTQTRSPHPRAQKPSLDT